MIDQLFIGRTGSHDDFGASVRERKDIKPKKKSIKETVPFSNVTHDFSAIDGEIYWEERQLEYVFEIMADTAEELEVKKQPFVSWVMNVMKEELHDPFIKDYHFIATFDDIDIDDSEVEKATITVKFTAYPYMISNKKRAFVYTLTEDEISVSITNNSSHRITPTFTSSASFIMKKGDSSFGIPSGETTDAKFMFAPGENILKLQSTSGKGTLVIEFHEEVF